MKDEERRDVPRRLDAARNARDERVKDAGELENDRQVIRELRRKMEDQASRVREAEACGLPDGKERQTALQELEKQRRIVKSLATMLGWESVPPQETLERDVSALKARMKLGEEELGKARADVNSLQLELEAKRVCHGKDNEFLIQARDEASAVLKECRRVWHDFIAGCAALLGLPKLAEYGEYGGGAIRHGIESMKKKLGEAELTAVGVIEGAEEWKDDAKTAQAEVQRFRGALEKINEIRNDVIGRQHVNWSKHIYPLVAALNEAGFEGAEYEKARERVEATIKAAREMAAGAWCSETTEQIEMDVVLAEEFAEILFPFLEALEFYAVLGNWQGSKADAHESACDRDLGSRARAAMGHPDRDVPEIIDDDDVSGTSGGSNGDGT